MNNIIRITKTVITTKTTMMLTQLLNIQQFLVIEIN